MGLTPGSPTPQCDVLQHRPCVVSQYSVQNDGSMGVSQNQAELPKQCVKGSERVGAILCCTVKWSRPEGKGAAKVEAHC